MSACRWAILNSSTIIPTRTQGVQPPISSYSALCSEMVETRKPWDRHFLAATPADSFWLNQLTTTSKAIGAARKAQPPEGNLLGLDIGMGLQSILWLPTQL